jgi:diguanylate cyclase (GGDEF) domain
MYKSVLEVIDIEKWNRKILNIFWIISILALITEILVFFFCDFSVDDKSYYIKAYILEPLLRNVICLFICETVYALIKDKSKEKVKYLLVIFGTMLTYNLVYTHYSVNVVYVLFIVPIIISVLYGNKKLTFFAFIINLLCYFEIYFIYLPTKSLETYNHSFRDFFVSIIIMIGVLVLMFYTISRMDEIVKSLIEEYNSKEELALRNFVMEFNSKIEQATGLYNHKTFYQYLECLIEQSDNYNFLLSLVVIDIDNFKRINDTYGHGLGDEVIKELAEILKASIGTDDYAARYGGEEFAIILTDKDKEAAFLIAEKIRLKFEQLVIEEMKDEKFTISIGISQYESGMSNQLLFNNADLALYDAKHSGKNRTIIYK